MQQRTVTMLRYPVNRWDDRESTTSTRPPRCMATPLWEEQVRPAAGRAHSTLKSRVTRLDDAGLLRGRTVEEASLEFHALCEGLAALELRDPNPGWNWEQRWAFAFATQVAGFAARPTVEARPAPHRPR